MIRLALCLAIFRYKFDNGTLNLTFGFPKVSDSVRSSCWIPDRNKNRDCLNSLLSAIFPEKIVMTGFGQQHPLSYD